MKRGSTNFAYLMDLLGIRAEALCAAVGADRSLVSRWRSGARKLMAGHHWAGKIAAEFVRVDDGLRRPVLRDVLNAYYPGEDTTAAQQRQALLTHWLTSAGQRESEYQRERAGLFDALMERVEKLSAPQPKPEPEPSELLPVPKPENTVVYGVKGVQGSTLYFLDMMIAQPEPQQFLFVCPEGLEMYTRDTKYGPVLMDKAMEAFARGHRLDVVLRTDYRMTDVSAFSGRWLVAHLLGYIHSHYFDEFHKTYQDKMLLVIQNKMAMKVTNSPDGEVYTSIHFDKTTVDKVWQEAVGYRRRSKQRFHYGLFEQPQGFLQGLVPLADREHYRFSRLPHFGLRDMDTVCTQFSLSADEAGVLRREFGPLFTEPGWFEADTPVRHIFCEEAIEDALLKSRHICPELAAMLGRRVFILTPVLVSQLVHMKALLETHRNFEVCFLSEDVFKKLTMQIACWGDKAAIGWIPGGKSAACKDYTNVNALTGFCSAVWDKIPNPVKSRRTALRKINTWLKKAEKYGYSVTG